MKYIILTIILITILTVGSILLWGKGGLIDTNSSSSNKIAIVAAENFYADIASQLGGGRVQVTSILSDPNADPHEYESSIQDAVAVANADLVIKNGAGYDTWMDKLLSASPKSNRVVITEDAIAKDRLGNNPHYWYSVENMDTLASTITQQLIRIDPGNEAKYRQNLAVFENSLIPLSQKMNQIKAQFGATPIGLTETIFLYQTQQMDLNVTTPNSFEEAIAEGNDPSAIDVAKTNDQISKRRVKVLVYNSQTITPITTNLQTLAQESNIPIVSITESMPADMTYQSWMLNQLNHLSSALENGSLKK